MNYDVVIIGAGLAGLTLSRHLMLEDQSLRILVLDKASEIPGSRQKVGESTIQIGGWYFGKTLDLEGYLQTRHYMKYNLRYYWKNPGTSGAAHEDYNQSYIRSVSNIPCYQLDRNELEREILDRNRKSEKFKICLGVANLEVSLSKDGSAEHIVAYSSGDGVETVKARWVIDAASRSRVLGRKTESLEQSPIRHGSSWFWLDGLVDVCKLTDLSHSERLLHPHRRHLGHMPEWLATNHFMGEGLWFWVIPLQGLTSLGLVFDHRYTKPSEVLATDKLLAWVDREFPLFSADFRKRKLLDAAMLRDYSHGVKAAISPERWAITGEAGRFLDPLYSTGSDFIALHNTMIAAAIRSERSEPHAKFSRRVAMQEQVLRSLYESYFVTYDTSYRVLGDQEAFSLKYTWELSLYFSWYVMPFINGLFTDEDFAPEFLARFARIGTASRNVLMAVNMLYDWKKQHHAPSKEFKFHDFMSMPQLQNAEKNFYRVGMTSKECLQALDESFENLTGLGRSIIAHIAARMTDTPSLRRDAGILDHLNLMEPWHEPGQLQLLAGMANGREIDCPLWRAGLSSLEKFAR